MIWKKVKNLCKGLWLGLAVLSPTYLIPVYAYPSMEGIQIYQKSLHHLDQREAIAADIERYHNATNIWDVLRREFVLPHYEDSPQVQEQIAWFMQHQDFLLESANRAAPYLYYILQQVHKRRLPAEVALLPVFESAYNPFAYSSAGAAGIWQLMSQTASGYGIKQNWWYDGRRDVIVSTKAALTHLSYLANFFNNNWLLALAAYDAGQGSILAAINRNIRDGYSTAYWNLPLPHETRVYVPRLLALATIIARPDKYPVYFPPVRNAPYLAQIDVGTQIDLQQAAALAGLELKRIKQLNPGYSHMITDPTGPYKLVLPIENVQQFTENLDQSPFYKPRLQWVHYKVRAGDTLVALAKRFNSTPASLRKLNQLALNKRLKPGTNLVIPRNTGAPHVVVASVAQQYIPIKNRDSNKTLAMMTAVNNATHTNYTIQPGDTVYMTRAGDDIQKIAAHFHLKPQDLLAANPINSSGLIHENERMIIPTHLRAMNKVLKYQLLAGDTIYMVRPGDTIETIAKKFHSSAPEIRVANLIADSDLREGDRLVIPTHA